VTIAGLLLTTTLGAAVLALWCHVRWPGAAPTTIRGSIVRVLIGFAALHLSAAVLEWAAGVSVGAVIVSYVGVIVPVLTFAFLATLWVMKLFADALKGYV
jgi:hypothetical protein